MPFIFDKDNTEHTAEVERCVKAAKAQTPPITESAALLAEVLQNSTIKFRTDNAKKQKKSEPLHLKQLLHGGGSRG